MLYFAIPYAIDYRSYYDCRYADAAADAMLRMPWRATALSRH